MSPVRRVKKRVDQALTDVSVHGDTFLDVVLRYREWAVWVVLAAIAINVVFGVARVANLIGQGSSVAAAFDASGASAFFNLGWVLLLVAAVMACAAVRRPTTHAFGLTLLSAVVVALGAVLELVVIGMAFTVPKGGWLPSLLSFFGALLDLVPRVLVAAVLWLVWHSAAARAAAHEAAERLEGHGPHPAA